MCARGGSLTELAEEEKCVWEKSENKQRFPVNKVHCWVCRVEAGGSGIV